MLKLVPAAVGLIETTPQRKREIEGLPSRRPLHVARSHKKCMFQWPGSKQSARYSSTDCGHRASGMEIP